MKLSLNKIVAVVLFLCASGVFWITGVSNIRDLAEGLVAAYFLTWGLYALLSELPREEVLRRFILTTVASISCLLVLELPAIFGRIDYRLVFSTPGVELWRKPGDVMDTELLWARQPHLQLKGYYERGNVGEALCLPPHPPLQYDLVYDHNGFRNDSDLATADIAVIGDSFVESPMIPSAALMTSLLGQLHTSTVANLGVSGYGPQQELAVMNRYALQLNPKTIVWVFYGGNDLRNVHEYDEQVATLSQDVEFLKSRWQRSFTRNALWTFFSLPRTCTPNADLAQHYVVAQDAEGRQERVYFVAKENELALNPREMDSLRKIRSTFEAAYQITRERGIQFMVVFAPDTHRVYLG
ncbi:MAG: SGNH/GDSL hydrolase family protein, partial [Nitrospiraceae bacterium]